MGQFFFLITRRLLQPTFHHNCPSRTSLANKIRVRSWQTIKNGKKKKKKEVEKKKKKDTKAKKRDEGRNKLLDIQFWPSIIVSLILAYSGERARYFPRVYTTQFTHRSIHTYIQL